MDEAVVPACAAEAVGGEPGRGVRVWGAGDSEAEHLGPGHRAVEGFRRGVEGGGGSVRAPLGRAVAWERSGRRHAGVSIPRWVVGAEICSLAIRVATATASSFRILRRARGTDEKRGELLAWIVLGS